MNDSTSTFSGRIVRVLTRREDEIQPLEQWFLIGIDDDEKALEAISSALLPEDVAEIVGHIPAESVAKWKLDAGAVRLVLPGEPIGD